MTWLALLAAALACYLLKLLGTSLPPRLLAGPRAARTAVLLPVALLCGLLAVAVGERGGAVVLDARVPALLLAAFLLWRGAPFLVVVAAAAALAAAWRLLV